MVNKMVLEEDMGEMDGFGLDMSDFIDRDTLTPSLPVEYEIKKHEFREDYQA